MLEQFFENNVDISSIKKSTYQVLCIPNITRQSNLNQDSYVLVMENVIKELNKIRDDLFFHIPITEFCRRLDFDITIWIGALIITLIQIFIFLFLYANKSKRIVFWV